MMNIKELSNMFLLISFSPRMQERNCKEDCGECNHIGVCLIYANWYDQLLKGGEYH